MNSTGAKNTAEAMNTSDILINKHTSISDCTLIELPRIHHDAGNLTPIQDQEGIPFPIKRVFYIYDIPGGQDRGAHAHRTCHQFLIAASGSFEIELTDGHNKHKVFLNRPYFGLHIPPGIWAAEVNFSSGSVCLVFTSHTYDASDYIREYEEYLEFINNKPETSAARLTKNAPQAQQTTNAAQPQRTTNKERGAAATNHKQRTRRRRNKPQTRPSRNKPETQ